MNRTAGRFVMLRHAPDFAAFQRIMIEAHDREPLPILAYCLMGNHWHFVVKPTQEGQMSRFFRWLTLTHAVRWRVAHHSVGYGHLYRGRFKAFPVQPGPRLRQVLRYVERNALSADLVAKAQDWPWSSLHARRHGPDELRQLLAPWPHGVPADWVKYVNQPITPAELSRLDTSESRGRPYGEDTWVDTVVTTLGLQHTIRKEGRPKKENGG
jgi:putative transposase